MQNSCHSSFEQTDLMVYFLLVIVTSVTSVFWDWHQGDPIRSVLLVGNKVFSETALQIFLIYCMKLGDYKGRKVTQLDFWKKFLIWRYSRKSFQISPKSDTPIFFSKIAIMIFFGFWPEVSTKYDLQFAWNRLFLKTAPL